jgi:hypothetical protein
VGSNPAEGLNFKGDKNPQHTFLRMEIKAGGFTAYERSVDVSKILNKQNSHSFVHSFYSLQMYLLIGLPKSSGRRVRSYSQLESSSSPWLSRSHLPG